MVDLLGFIFEGSPYCWIMLQSWLVVNILRFFRQYNQTEQQKNNATDIRNVEGTGGIATTAFVVLDALQKIFEIPPVNISLASIQWLSNCSVYAKLCTSQIGQP